MRSLDTLVFAALLGAIGCAGAPQSPPTAASGPARPAARTFAEQVAAGQKLYAENCAACHGDGGEGKKAPRVVGLKDGALSLGPPAGARARKMQFKTVADVADFVVHSMPPKQPGSLPPDDYWSILAFDLKANGIDLGDKLLDGPLASTLTIPR